MNKKSTIITASILGLAFAVSACTGGNAEVETPSTPAPGVQAPAPAPTTEAPAPSEVPSEKPGFVIPKEKPSVQKVTVSKAIKDAYKGEAYKNLITESQDIFFTVQQGLIDAYVPGDRMKIVGALEDRLTKSAREKMTTATEKGDQALLDALYPSSDQQGVLFTDSAGKTYKTSNAEISPITAVRTKTPSLLIAEDGRHVLYDVTYTLYVRGVADDGTRAMLTGSANAVYTLALDGTEHWDLADWWIEYANDGKVEVGA